jgi:hypothetical protein
MGLLARMRAVAIRRLPGALCGLLLALGACKDEPPAGPSVGTNSNWLRACSTSAECGDLPACECGACTARCANDGECGAIEDARCALGEVDPAAWAECESRTPQLASGLCLPRCDPGSCGDGQACVSSACVLTPLPELPFCDGVAEWDGGARTREEELLALLQNLRVAGASCPEGETVPAPALRFDPRLVCAARVWASDIDDSGESGRLDSQGRTGGDRVMAAGYSPRQWWESFAYDVPSAERALQVMLADGASCARLTDALYTDVGVGGIGDTLVVTIATE